MSDESPILPTSFMFSAIRLPEVTDVDRERTPIIGPEDFRRLFLEGRAIRSKIVHSVFADALMETHRLASEARFDANSTIRSNVSDNDGSRALSTEAMSLNGAAAANTALTDISLPSSARESAMTVAYNRTSSSEEPSAKVSILKKLIAPILRLKARLCRESLWGGKRP